MAIHFVCACGKHLKARDNMRGRISFCPACGAHVKISYGEATHSGVVADLRSAPLPIPVAQLNSPAWLPMSLQEGSNVQDDIGAQANRHVARTAVSRDRPLTGADRVVQNTAGNLLPGEDPPEILVRRYRRPDLTSHNRIPERLWFESVRYTLPVCSLFAGLATALALVSGAALCAMSGALPDIIPSGSGEPFFVPCLALLAALLSITSAVLSGVLALAVDGSKRVVSTLGFEAVLRAIVQWLASFAAGPALLLAAAVAYWFLCGDPGVADGLILAELIAIAGGGFLVNLVLTCKRGGLSRLNPAAALQAAWLLGWRVVAVSVVAAAALSTFGWFGGFVLAKLHVAVVEGFLWLGLWWFCTLVLAAFSFRRLGLWYRSAAAMQPSFNARDRKQRGLRTALASTPN
jgi:hypothetical protein